MADKIQIRGDVLSEWQRVNPVLSPREMSLCTDINPPLLKVGDGLTHWNSLPWATNNVASATVNGSGHLILTWNDGSVVDCGAVIGPAGSTGATGPSGRTVLNGSGAPAAGVGSDGDFYIDTAAHTIYGPKTSGAWGTGTSLVGPSGSAQVGEKTVFIPAGFTYAPVFRSYSAKTINRINVDCISSAGAAQAPTSLVVTVYGGSNGSTLLYTSSAITTASPTPFDVSLSIAAGDIIKILVSNTTGLTGGVSVSLRW